MSLSKMFSVLIIIVTGLVSTSLGIPLESESYRDMKSYLSTRIVGGVDAPPGYGDHMAALVWGEMSTHLMCGSSIVTKQHILTAAHCIVPMVVGDQLLPSFRAVIGSNKWASTKKNIGFTGYINHPGFKWHPVMNDIGVLYLAEDLTLHENVAIIPLNFDWVDGGTKSYATGWGRLGISSPISDTLQILSLYTITPDQCLEGLREASSGWGPASPYDSKTEICTFHSIGHGMCHGDSGSALVQKDTRKQIGIVSWGLPCARGAPDVFVRISAFKDWILQILGPHIHI